MKDIIIASREIKRERNIYLVYSPLSFAVDTTAVLVHARPWAGTSAQLEHVLVISFSIYFILWIPHILVIGLRHLLRKKK